MLASCANNGVPEGLESGMGRSRCRAAQRQRLPPPKSKSVRVRSDKHPCTYAHPTLMRAVAPPNCFWRKRIKITCAEGRPRIFEHSPTYSLDSLIHELKRKLYLARSLRRKDPPGQKEESLRKESRTGQLYESDKGFFSGTLESLHLLNFCGLRFRHRHSLTRCLGRSRNSRQPSTRRASCSPRVTLSPMVAKPGSGIRASRH